MNKPFYNPENIESYLANKMSAGDMARFENELAKDPLLQNEINLQKDIVNSLKDFRKAELKARLNNIEVGLGSNYTGIKVAATIILASLLSFGSYYYFTGNADQSNKETQNTPQFSPVASDNSSENKADNAPVITESKKSEVIEKTESKASKKDVVINKKKSPKEIDHADPTVKAVDGSLPAFNSPEVKDQFGDNEKFQSEPGIQMPKGDVGETTDNHTIKDLHVEVKNTRKQFHYQYYNHKLFLFGDFDSNPYEIFELNTKKGKELYLFHNNEFYGLKQGQTKLTPLQVIKDSEKLSALNALRNK
jgi:hypothetical protein